MCVWRVGAWGAQRTLAGLAAWLGQRHGNLGSLPLLSKGRRSTVGKHFAHCPAQLLIGQQWNSLPKEMVMSLLL